MKPYLETCSLQQIYSQIHHIQKNKLGIPTYITPKSCLENLSVYQPVNKDNRRLGLSRQYRKPKNIPNYIQIDQRRSQLRLIPADKGFFREKFNQIKNFVSSSPSCKFEKQQRHSSYIDKQKLSNVKAGPGEYDAAKAFDKTNQKSQFHKLPQIINKENIRRRMYTEGDLARSIEIPGVGQYNVQSQKTHCRLSKWEKHAKQIEGIKQKQNDKAKLPIKSNNKQTPAPTSYTPLPRSFSLFSTLNTKEKNVLKHPEFNKRLNQKNKTKQKTMKNNFDRVGPGKYLNLDDWKDNIDDRKGNNFVSRVKTQSVYR